MILASVVVCVLIFFHYKRTLELDILFRIRQEKDNLINTGIYKKLLFEILLNMLICPPNVDSYIDLEQMDGDL